MEGSGRQGVEGKVMKGKKEVQGGAVCGTVGGVCGVGVVWCVT